MGRDLFGRDPFADELFECATEAAGVDLKKLCSRGPSRKLDETENLQPALAALSLALLHRLVEAGVQCDATAGHSLGELPALVASGMSNALDVVELAATRGRLMGEAASRTPGSMIAVTGLSTVEVAAAIEPFKRKGVVSEAAINAPSQMTISGDPHLIDEISGVLGAKSDVRVTRLRVSGAWHSEHMRPAVGPFSKALEALEIKAPKVPMLFNRDGREVFGAEQVRERIAGQLERAIRWDKVMGRFMEMGITDFVEIGPGKVLRGLVRLNIDDSRINVHNISDRRSLDRTVETIC
ncbi:MAG: ACP S-malonyltransferase [Deltaproteobacteria bacterium]|nr:ACP S-malonyltransferase [Deltaproteobacteria bacterium]